MRRQELKSARGSCHTYAPGASLGSPIPSSSIAQFPSSQLNSQLDPVARKMPDPETRRAARDITVRFGSPDSAGPCQVTALNDELKTLRSVLRKKPAWSRPGPWTSDVQLETVLGEPLVELLLFAQLLRFPHERLRVQVRHQIIAPAINAQ